jgi:glycosyltransferase involved in cell wall biosynthesis
LRLAAFTGQYFWFDGQQYSTDEAFVEFVKSFRRYFKKITLCDSLAKERAKKAYRLDASSIDFCPLPHFSVYSVWRNLFLVYPEVYRRIKERIAFWDLIWIHAPHPIGLLFAFLCWRRKKPFFLFVRQNMVDYVRLRNDGGKARVATLVALGLESIFRRISRSTLTFAVGREIYDLYSQIGGPVCQAIVSLISDEDIRDVQEIREGVANEPVPFLRILSVGRLDPEKGTIYLIRAAHELVSRGWRSLRLDLVGTGQEEGALRREVQRLGLTEHVRFLGYIHYGPELLAVYRASDVFVLPSLTEGFPQTLLEAMGCGIPIVATRVGGVSGLLKDGRNGLLVDPASPGQICSALRRLKRDGELRRRMVINGLETAKDHTVELETRRIVDRINTFFGPILLKAS